jgi:AAA domain
LRSQASKPDLTMVNRYFDQPNITTSQDWGYRFTSRAAVDNFIKAIQGDAVLAEYSDYRDRRQYAEYLMQELFAQTPHLFYVRRKGEGQNQNEQKWELTVATDLDNAELPKKLRDLARTLQLIAVINIDNYPACLRIISVRLLPTNQGKLDAFSQSFLLRLRSNHLYNTGVPQTAIEQMAFAPRKQDYLPTSQQLEAWSAYVNIEERKARERQFSVSFVSHNYGRATRNISFAVEPQSANNGSVSRSLDLDDFWKRAERAINNKIKISSQLNSDGRELGEIVSADREQNVIRIHLNSETVDDIERGEYILPMGGILAFEPSGNITEIKRKRDALEKLAAGQAINPYLGKFLFNASEARTTQELIKIDSSDLLLKSINPSQKLAVEQVISAPDLALIQGPPGTGKTTVIAEICYQVARLGGRTLIASQANLAVDNALSRLKHNPIIRAVRKGNRDSVSIEGEPFLEDKVVGTWLSHTATDCQHRLDEKRKTATIINLLLESSERFETYLAIEINSKPLQEQLQRQIAVQQGNVNLLRQRLQCLTPSINVEHLDYALIFETIDRHSFEIDRWSSRGNLQVNVILERCLQNNQHCRVEMIDLPTFLPILSSESKNLLWKESLQKCLNKFNQLVELHQHRERIYALSRKLDIKIRELDSLVPMIDNDLRCLISNQIEINRYDSIKAISILQREAEKSIDILSKPTTIWMKRIQSTQNFVYDLKLSKQPSQRLIAAATIVYVAEKLRDIIQSLKLHRIHNIVETISKDCVRNIVVFAEDWFNQIKNNTRSLQENQDLLDKTNLQLSKYLTDREDNRSWWTEYW